jgi:hypothetical protein
MRKKRRNGYRNKDRENGEGKANPITGLDRPWRFQDVETTQISRQPAHEGGKASALHTGRFYPAGNIPGTNFC